MEKLRFSPVANNAKLYKLKKGYSFSLPAGYACPGALKCLAKAEVKNGKAKLVDGKEQEFRCFAATQEVRFPVVRNQRWYNFDLLKKCKSAGEMVKLINESLPKDAEIVRVHVSGDFYNKDYMAAWMIVAELNPAVIFYAYTKSIHLLKNMFIPNNFKMNASFGGRYDHLIDELKLKHVKVFYSEKEAEEAGYELDHTDEMAFKQDESFGLLLHGSQSKGSEAGKAWQKIKTTVGGYSKKNNLLQEAK